MGGLSGATASLKDSPIAGGDAGPSQSGPIRGGDLALGGINIGAKGGIDFNTIALVGGGLLVAFFIFKKFG